MSLVMIPFVSYIIIWKKYFSLLIMIIIRWNTYSAKGCVKQTTSSSLEDIRHVPKISPPLPPPTPYLRIS